MTLDIIFSKTLASGTNKSVTLFTDSADRQGKKKFNLLKRPRTNTNWALPDSTTIMDMKLIDRTFVINGFLEGSNALTENNDLWDIFSDGGVCKMVYDSLPVNSDLGGDRAVNVNIQSLQSKEVPEDRPNTNKKFNIIMTAVQGTDKYEGG